MKAKKDDVLTLKDVVKELDTNIENTRKEIKQAKALVTMSETIEDIPKDIEIKVGLLKIRIASYEEMVSYMCQKREEIQNEINDKESEK